MIARRFLIEHDVVTRSSRLVDSQLLQMAEFCYAPDGSLGEIADACEARPELFLDFASGPFRVLRGGR